MTNVIKFPTPVSIADQVRSLTPEERQDNWDDTLASVTPTAFAKLMDTTPVEVLNMDYDDQLLIWKQVNVIYAEFDVSNEERIHLDDLAEIAEAHPHF